MSFCHAEAKWTLNVPICRSHCETAAAPSFQGHNQERQQREAAEWAAWQAYVLQMQELTGGGTGAAFLLFKKLGS